MLNRCFFITRFSPIAIRSEVSQNIALNSLCKLRFPYRNLASSSKKKNTKSQSSKEKKRADILSSTGKRPINPLSKFPPGVNLNSFITTRSNIEALHLSKSIDIERALSNTEQSSEGLPFSIINEFSSLCGATGIKISAFKQRNRYIKPCHQRRALMYASRKEKYNRAFDEKVSEIVKNYGHEIEHNKI